MAMPPEHPRRLIFRLVKQRDEILDKAGWERLTKAEENLFHR